MAVDRWALLSSKVLDNTVTLDIDSDATDNKSERSEKTDDTEVVSIESDQYSSSDEVKIKRKLSTVSHSLDNDTEDQTELAEAVINGNKKRVKSAVESHFYKLGEKAVSRISQYQYTYNPDTLYVESTGFVSLFKMRAASATLTTGLYRVNQLLSRFTTNLNIIDLACIFDQEHIISLLYSYGIGKQKGIMKPKICPAHVSAWYGSIGSLAMLCRLGDHIDISDIDGKTPLHLSTIRGHKDVVKFLINEGSSLHNQDAEGRTPLHLAALEGRRDIVHLLLAHGADYNKVDKDNCTPLHLATSRPVLQTLLNRGADPAIKMSEEGTKKTVFGHFLRDIPDFCNDILTSYISTNFVSLSAQNLRVCINYDLIQREMDSGEMDCIHNVIMSDQIELLKHPVCESFIHLKDLHYGLKLRFHFLFSYLLFLCLLTFLILLNHSPYFLPLSLETQARAMQVLIPVIFFFSIAFMLKEFLIIIITKTKFPLSFHKCVWSIFLACVFIYLILIIFSQEVRTNFITQLATIIIFLGWINITFVLGQFPSIGIYVLMLENVARDVMKFLLIYSCTLLAFALSFHLILPTTGFANPLISLLTTLTMMYGEIEFTSEVTRFHGVTEVLIILFLVFVGIIIMNLLIGLSVSEISQIFIKAGVNRLKLTTQQVRNFSNIKQIYEIHIFS